MVHTSRRSRRSGGSNNSSSSDKTPSIISTITSRIKAQQEISSMTSTFFSNILTTTSSKYNNLRRQLISSEADGDTEDDSHISRVIRAYYTEKSRAFPEWLPPDPKAPPPTQFVSSSSTATGPGFVVQQPSQQAGSRSWGRGGLSDLWEGGSKQAPQESESLRQRPSLRNANSTSFGSGPPTPSGRFPLQQQTSYLSQDHSQIQGRPLPSQREGSYQSQFSSRFSAGTADNSPPRSSGNPGGGTAQERLKARLWGAGRSGSPTPSAASGTSSIPSPPPSIAGGGGGNPYGNNALENGRLGASPSKSSSHQDNGRFGYGSGQAGASGGYSGGSSRPVMSANSPWSSGDDYGGGGGYNARPTGLPPGPRAGRQGLGLPDGPRPKR